MIAGFGSDVAAKQIDELTANGAPWVGESVTDEVGQHGLLGKYRYAGGFRASRPVAGALDGR